MKRGRALVAFEQTHPRGQWPKMAQNGTPEKAMAGGRHHVASDEAPRCIAASSKSLSSSTYDSSLP